MKRWGSAWIIALGLLLGLMFASAHDYTKVKLNAGLAAARSGNYAAAHAVWFPLARNGNVEAQYRLGWLSETGRGVEKNSFIAAKFYSQAALRGHANAQYNLGIMFTQGRGVTRDDASAARYFLKAAVQGHSRAQYDLAVLYQYGRGVTQDISKARYWFYRAAGKGFTNPNSAARV